MAAGPWSDARVTVNPRTDSPDPDEAPELEALAVSLARGAAVIARTAEHDDEERSDGSHREHDPGDGSHDRGA